MRAAVRFVGAWWSGLDESVRDIVLLIGSAPLAYVTLCGAFAL